MKYYLVDDDNENNITFVASTAADFLTLLNKDLLDTTNKHFCTEEQLNTRSSMNHADYIAEIAVQDPDSHAMVDVTIYKDRNSGAMFGVDSSYIQTLSDDDPVIDPFNGHNVILNE